MAQLSRLAKLYYKISDNFTEKDVSGLRFLIAADDILGKAKVEKATTLQIFNMLSDNDTIGKGNLGLLVQILRCLGKGKLANEAERLEQEHKMEGREIHETTAMTLEPNASEDEQRDRATVTRSSSPDDSEPETTEVKEIISVRNPSGALAEQDNQQTSEAPEDTDMHCATSELASLHIRELVRLRDEPMKALGPSKPDTSTDVQDAKSRLETLLAELDTPAVMADQEKQCDLYCQIGDLYRAKLYDLQSALQYYQSMLECSKSLSETHKQAKAHNRLGLTYDIIGKHEEATRNHERVLEICRDVDGDEVDICVAYKNLATSLTLSSKVSEAKTNYKTALRLARKTGNKIEEMDIHCKLGDLHRVQLKESQISHKYYTNMLVLATELRSKYWEMLSYNRLGLACEEMQDNEQALHWSQKNANMIRECADKRDQIIAHMNVGVLLGRVKQPTPHLDTALQMAQEEGDEYRQMDVYLRMGDMQREQLHSPRTAIQYYEQALALARQLGDRSQEGVAYSRVGLAHCEMGEYGAALEWYQKHLKISQESGDKKAEVTAHVAVGDAYRLLGNTEQATSHFDTALQLAQQTENRHGQMYVNCKMGDLQREQLHSPRTSIQIYEKYLALARQLTNCVEEAVAYERLGLAHYEMGEYEKALGWYQKHLDLSQDNGDNRQQIRAHTNLGCTYRLLGKLDQATSHHSTALQIAEQTRDQHEQMGVYHKIGDMHRIQLHSPRTSIQYYEQHLALARQLGDRRGEGWAYNRLGDAYVDMIEYEAALDCYQKHRKISQEIEDKKAEVTAHADVGNAYRFLGKIEQATSHFDTALEMAKQTDNQQGQMDVYCKMGDLQREQLHSPRTAIQYYEQALALARQLGDKHEEGVAYNRLGQAHSAMEEYETAVEWDEKDLKIRQEDEDKTKQLTPHKNIAASYKALGKLDQARSHYQSALTIAMETGNKQEQMDTYLSLGDLHREQLHEPQASHKYYTEMLALAKDLEKKDKERLAYNRLGLACGNMQGNESALEWHQKELKMSQEDGDNTGQITAHKNIARSYQALGKLDQARSHYQSALTIAMETGNKQEQMDTYLTLGDLHREQLRSPRTAIQYYEQHLALASQLEDRRQERVAYNRLGHAHNEMGLFEVALEWRQKYLEASQESGEKKEQIAANANVGNTYRLLGKLEQATSHLDTALQLAQQTGDLHDEMQVYFWIGDLQREQLHSPRTSIQYYEQALALARQLKDVCNQGVAYSTVGQAYYDMGEHQAALEWFQKCLKMLQESGNKTQQIAAHQNIATSNKELGKLDLVRSHYQSALAIAMETGNKQEQEDITKKLASL